MVRRILQVLTLGAALIGLTVHADAPPLQLGVGLFQPDKEKNDATYRPMAEYLSTALGRKVMLRTVDTWEGLAKSLATGETDLALMGPWGYVLANHQAGAQAIATILYDGRPEYYAIIVTNPKTGIERLEDLRGRTFAFGDKGSTSGYLIPVYQFQKMGIDPDAFFSKVVYTKHQAIETQVARSEIDAGADYNRNRNAMITDGLIKAEDSKIIWTSAPLPNDAFAVSADIAKGRALVGRLQEEALEKMGGELKARPELLPVRYTGFVKSDNAAYAPIREAGLATGKLAPVRR